MRTNTAARASLLLLVTLFSKVALSMKMFTLTLENYNGWNLPFAKTVNAVIDIAPFTGHSSQEFVVDMDASALFSVLFTTQDINTDSTINYTISAMDSLTLKGTWANVTYTVGGLQHYDSSSDEATTFSFNYSTFIAKSEQINGLDGTLGLAPAMMKSELRDYNFIYAFQTAKNVNLEAMYYNIVQAADSLFAGTLVFYNNTMDILDSDTDEYARLDNVNVINMRKLVDDYYNSTILDAFAAGAPQDLSNPFFQYELIQLQIEGWFIGSTRMLNQPGHYPHTVNISTTLSGMMVQQNFYREFNDAFIDVLCSNATDIGLSEYKIGYGKQLSVSNWQCGCGGGGITGMPSIFMDMGSPSGGLVSPGKKVSYALPVDVFTQFQKIEFGTRGEMCDLAIQNVGHQQGAFWDTDLSMNDILMGKAFLRAYPFAMTFSEDSSTVTIAIAGPSDHSDFLVDVLMVGAILGGLLCFTCSMTGRRRRRYNADKSLYFRIKKLQEEDPAIITEMFRLKNQQKGLAKDAQAGVKDTITKAQDLTDSGKLGISGNGLNANTQQALDSAKMAVEVSKDQ